MYRYIERAENTARIMDAGLRMALTRSEDAATEWAPVLKSSDADEGYCKKYEQYSVEHVVDYLLRDRDNPSSVVSCIEYARSNARMVRTALTREAWESVNESCLLFRQIFAKPVPPGELPVVLDQIKRSTALILGSFYSTLLRNEIFDFAQIGAFIERADNTARILDVKYHVLLPSVSQVGGMLDTYQWESILRSVSAHRSYRWVYDVQYRPVHIADYLILNRRMPRSLRFCYGWIARSLDHLTFDYGTTHPCHETAAGILKSLTDKSVERIFRSGLHEFLTDFINRNNSLGAEIAQAYNFD